MEPETLPEAILPIKTKVIPPFGQMLLPGLFWAICCFTAGVVVLVFARGWVVSAQSMQVGLIYAAGAALAVWPSVVIARYFVHRSSVWRWAILLFLLLGLTTFITACLFALQYRIYFSQWHGEVFSQSWLWQQMFTAAGAVYTYIVLGLRLYIPIALAGLFVTSWWLNRLPD